MHEKVKKLRSFERKFYFDRYLEDTISAKPPAKLKTEHSFLKWKKSNSNNKEADSSLWRVSFNFTRQCYPHKNWSLSPDKLFRNIFWEVDMLYNRLGTSLASKSVASLLTGLLVEEGLDFVFSRSQAAFVLKKSHKRKIVKRKLSDIPMNWLDASAQFIHIRINKKLCFWKIWGY